MATTLNSPLLVIVGPTASGKTALAIDLAKRFNGEIICADSRTIYKGMNIGTAKPTVPEMQSVKHHLLDVVEPGEPFTVADFKRLADQAITNITERGKLPILVGGSGLYIDSVIYNYDFAATSSERDPQNPRHLAADAPRQNLELRPNTLVIGIQVDPVILKERIIKRIDGMLEAGLQDETIGLGKQFGWDIPPMQAPAYKAFRGVAEGTKTVDQAKADFDMYDSRLAKKQRTWFKRNNSIQWVTDPSESVDLVTTFLNN